MDNIDHIDGLLTPDLSPDNIPVWSETPVITIFGAPPLSLHLLTHYHRNVLTPSSGCPQTHRQVDAPQLIQVQLLLRADN